MSFARLGSWSADLSTVFARPLYEQGWQPPLVLALCLAALSFAAAALYFVVERRGIARRHIEPPAPPAGFRPRDLGAFGLSYWALVGLCVTFYAVIFAFRSTFAIKYFQHAQALDLQQAGLLNSHVFLATVVATPFFGWLSDRIGRRTLLLMAGSALLPASFAVLGTTHANLWVSTAMTGICYALVPAVLWPATALIVPRERLGLAFGDMTVLQNLGIAAANSVAGTLDDRFGAGADNPGGYDAMLWFFGLVSLAGFLFAALLWSRRRIRGTAVLERPAAAPGPAPD
jgi:MFS family permease